MFEPKTHIYSKAFRGNPERALDIARAALLATGFEILVDTESELQALGPGMTNNKQPPLLGVSLLRLKSTQSKITATAVLGSVNKMKTFLYLFPPLLALAIVIMHAAMGGTPTWFHLLWLAPWVVISPLIASSLERKTRRAVDGLVRSMTQAR